MNSLVATAIAVSIFAVSSGQYWQGKVRQWREDLGRGQGQQLSTLASGVDAYVATNFRALTGQGGVIVAADGAVGQVNAPLAPSVSELLALGYLTHQFAATSYVGGGYRITLSQQGSCPDHCTIGGLVTLARPWLREGVPDLSAIGAALQAVGSDAGVSTTAAPATLSGLNGGWSAPNPVSGQPAGIVGVRVGTDASRFNTYYRRDGALPLTAALNLGGQSIERLGQAAVGVACVGIGGLAVAASGELLFCDATQHYQSNVVRWKPAVATIVALNALTGNQTGDVRRVSGLGQQAFMWDGSVWQGLAVDAAGQMTISGRLTAGEYLQINGTAIAGAPCSSNGLQGREDNGGALSCQDYVWRSKELVRKTLPGLPASWPQAISCAGGVANAKSTRFPIDETAYAGGPEGFYGWCYLGLYQEEIVCFNHLSGNITAGSCAGATNVSNLCAIPGNTCVF